MTNPDRNVSPPSLDSSRTITASNCLSFAALSSAMRPGRFLNSAREISRRQGKYAPARAFRLGRQCNLAPSCDWTSSRGDGRGWSWMVVDGLQYSLCGPSPVPIINRIVRRQIMRELPPSTACTCTVPNAVHDFPRVMEWLLHVPDPNRRWNHLFNEIPFGVGQIRRIRLTRRVLVVRHAQPFAMTSLVGPNFLRNARGGSHSNRTTNP